MPMIDIYAATGTFADPKGLAVKLAVTLKDIERVPDIPLFRKNTAAFVHELPDTSITNIDGDSNYVRVQVLTNAEALDRDQQIAVVEQFVAIVAEAADDEGLRGRTWVLLTEAIQGGWGLYGRAMTNDEIVIAAREQIANLSEQ